MRLFNEFHIHKRLDSNGETIVVYKDGIAHCMNITKEDTLNELLEYLDQSTNTGWAKDSDVGGLIETCNVKTHPEYFI